jgi:hypothetical protein
MQSAVHGIDVTQCQHKHSAGTAQLLQARSYAGRVGACVSDDERLTEQSCSTTKNAPTPPVPLQQSVFNLTLAAQTSNISSSVENSYKLNEGP